MLADYSENVCVLVLLLGHLHEPAAVARSHFFYHIKQNGITWPREILGFVPDISDGSSVSSDQAQGLTQPRHRACLAPKPRLPGWPINSANRKSFYTI